MNQTSISFGWLDETRFREQLVRLAARLGVDPINDDDGQMRMVVAAGDQRFDALEIMHAFLDRMDAAEKATHKPITHF